MEDTGDSDAQDRARREFVKRAVLAAGLLPVALPAFAQQMPPHPMDGVPSVGTPATVSILVYPGMVLLDLVGPLTVFSILQADVQLVWKERTPVMTDCRVPVTPTHDFHAARSGADVFFIPGGTMGTVACMKD
jgi:cyclohexyl-isocyanide hydratase